MTSHTPATPGETLPLVRNTPGQAVEAALGPAPLGSPGRYGSDLSRMPYASPLSPETELARIVWDDLIGANERPALNTRAAAMRLGPVIRGRNLLCGTIARFPLVVARGAEQLAQQPSWTTRTEDGSSPQWRTLWTIDDHLFHGWSLWHRLNGSDGFPLAATRVPFGDWYVSDDNWLHVNGSRVTDLSEWTLIPGLHEGILVNGFDILRDARDLFAIVRERLENNAPPLTLAAQPGATKLTPDEIDAVIASYKAARKRNGGVGYTNEFLKPEYGTGADDAELMIEARNAAAVDLARLIGVHAGMVDATAPKASLNYETTTGRNQEFVDFDLALPMLPLTSRLSLDDFVPHGQRVAFDLGDFTALAPSPTGPATED